MDPVLLVRPSGPLSGKVEIGGAKNSALKLIAAALLAEGESVLSNVPSIDDITTMLELVESMGVGVRRGVRGERSVALDASGSVESVAPYDLVRRMRASIIVLGPLLARFGHARVAMPGGCNLGARPIDLHLKALEQMGVEFRSSHGYLEARADHMRGANVLLEFPSVGATENILMAAVGADGETTIENAAREPEIADLCAFLNRMGAEVIGGGSSDITVRPAKGFVPVEHTVVPDRIEAGTFLAAVGVAGGEVTLNGARFDHLTMAISKLCDAGMLISATPEGIWAKASGRPKAIDVSTLPYPGFPTDLQPLAVAFLATAEGTGIVTENLFDGRFMYTEELVRMGADIRTEGRHAVIRGVERLSGAPITAPDLRAGAALAVAALAAEGETRVAGLAHIDRGYEQFAEKLAAIGADIRREE